MSQAARPIPGQSVTSRLVARVASRPVFGPSPSFFARFGLDDPWLSAGMGGGGPVDPNDPFVYVDGRHYFARVRRMWAARQRMMARFAAMDAGAKAHPMAEIQTRDTAKMRVSHLANLGIADATLLAPPAPAAEADETAGRWIERQREPKAKKERAERPMVVAVRRMGVDGAGSIAKALDDAGLSGPIGKRRALNRALDELRGLDDADQADVVRRVVRHIRGPQRRVVEVVVGEESTAPVAVAQARAQLGTKRKGLRTVMASSPSMVGISFEEPIAAEVAPIARRRTPVAPVVRTTAHRETPVAPVLREARTQRSTGRAGPPVVELSADAFEAPRPRVATETVARRLRASLAPAQIVDVRRGLEVVSESPVSATIRGTRRAVARAVVPQIAQDRVQLAASPVVSARRTLRASRAVVSAAPVLATPVVETAAPEAAPVRRTRAAAPVGRAERPVVERTVAAAATPVRRERRVVAAVAPTRRALARMAAPAQPVARTERLTAAPAAYVTAPSVVEATEVVPSAPIVRRGVARAAQRAVPEVRRTESGRVQIAPSPVAHVVRSVTAAPPAEIIVHEIVIPASGPARRVVRVAADAPTAVAGEPTVRAALRAETGRPRRASRSVIPTPTGYIAFEDAAVEAAVEPTLRRKARAAAVVAATPKARAVRTVTPSAPVARRARPAAAATPEVPQFDRAVVAPTAAPVAISEEAAALEAAPAAVRRRAARGIAAVAAPIEADEAPAVVASPVVRAIRRGASGAPAAPTERRGVLAPVPTAYVAAPVDVDAMEAPAPVAERATARVAARADAPEAAEPEVIASAPAAYARAEKVRGRVSRVSSPVASLLDPQADAPEITEAPVERARRSAAPVAAPERARAARRAPVVAAPRASRPEAEAVVAAEAPARRRRAQAAQIAARLDAVEAFEATPTTAPAARAERIASPEVASTPMVARAERLAAPSVAAPKVRASRLTPSTHALLRFDAVEPELADIQAAARKIVRNKIAQSPAVSPTKQARRAIRSWSVPVRARKEAPASAVVAPIGRATGPVSRSSLTSVLSRVSAAVRAFERPDQAPVLAESPRRALGVAAPVAERIIAERAVTTAAPTQRRSRTVAPTAIALAPAIEVDTAPQAVPARRAPARAVSSLVELERKVRAARPVARAESRAVIEADAAVASPTPVTRVIRRAFAGSPGTTVTNIEHVAARAQAVRIVRRTIGGVPQLVVIPVEQHTAAPAVAPEARLRTQRTETGQFAPAVEGRAASRASFGLGEPGIPRRRASLDTATGLVLLPAAEPMDEAGTASPAAPERRGVRAAASQAAQAPRKARRARPFLGTVGWMADQEPFVPSGPAAATRRNRRRPVASAVAAPAMEVLDPTVPLVESGEPDGGAPAWAARAIDGTLANVSRPSQRAAEPRRISRVGASGNVLTALARAGRPEEVVQIILERGGQLASVVPELSTPAARIVERIVRLNSEQAAKESSAAAASPDAKLLTPRRAVAAQPSVRRVRRKAPETTSLESIGSTQIMKLAQKLMSLVHLSEVDQKAEDAKKQVRLAEDSGTARAEGSASTAQSSGSGDQNVNIKALQRDVFEAVLRELELMSSRRQEDSNGRNHWW